MLEKLLMATSNDKNQLATPIYTVTSETEERFFNNSVYPFGFTQVQFNCEGNLLAFFETSIL